MQQTHLGIKELISPQSFHKLWYLNLKLVSIDLSKLFEGEGPAMKTRTKSNSSFGRINLHTFIFNKIKFYEVHMLESKITGSQRPVLHSSSWLW